MKLKYLLDFTYFVFSIYLLSACAPPEHITVAEKVPDIRVLLGTITSSDTLHLDGTFILQSEEASYEFGLNNSKFYIQKINKGYKIFNENRMFRFRNQDVCVFIPESSESSFYFRSGQFKGSFKVVISNSDQLQLINFINLEDYLRSVVPAEIYTSRDDFMESAKAQAICSRTYALQRMNERTDALFDVHMNVRDQVYGNISKQNKRATSAVNETRGVVLSYNDTLATVYYHSSCGGISEDASNVWAESHIPYLFTHQDVLGDSFACRFSPNHRWLEKRTLKQLDSMIQYHNDSGSLLDMVVDDTTLVTIGLRVSERFKSGRVKELVITTKDNRFILENYKIRRFLGWPPGTLLPSTLFRIYSSNDTTFVIEGGGAGHGVGMCQWGAMRMSEEGFQYYHILGKYFKGCYLKKIY